MLAALVGSSNGYTIGAPRAGSAIRAQAPLMGEPQGQVNWLGKGTGSQMNTVCRSE